MNFNIKNAIFGIHGFVLTEEERTFFAKINPLGFILFTRNCKNAGQIKTLVASLKECVGRDELLILIDQEGGRVARLKPPICDKFPPASYFGKIAIENSLEQAYKATYDNYLSIGTMLQNLGINVNCAPVADIYFPEANIVIGDRSFGQNIEIITQLCKASDQGLRDAKVQSIIKHIPGHGRAMKDSHHDLPVITADIDILKASDFQVFRNLSAIKMAMTAHVVYTALDQELPATLSPKAVEYIRDEIGFKGILITDALDMGALKEFGDLSQVAKMAIDAGVDVILHCTGNMEEMREVAKSLVNISDTLAVQIQNLNCFEHPSSTHVEL